MQTAPNQKVLSRIGFVLLMLILVPFVAVVTLVGWHYYRRQEGFRMVAAARAQLAAIGGRIDQGLVAGDFYVHLEDTELDDAQFAELAAKLQRFPRPHLDQRHRIQIYARNTHITDRAIVGLQGLPIIALDLRGTAVSDASVPMICTFSLWQLDLRKTNVSDASVSSISKLQLMTLGVSESKMTENGIRRLKVEMPNTQVK